MAILSAMTIRDTADVRAKLLRVWRLVDDKKITASEARLHIGLARAILDTLKVEIAMAHLNRSQVPSIPVAPAISISTRATRQSWP